MALRFPSPREHDDEDVAWGLTTGEALWNHGERLDALVWLRRAAGAASEAGQDARADELTARAAELKEALESGTFDSFLPPPLPSDAARLAQPDSDAPEIEAIGSAEIDDLLDLDEPEYEINVEISPSPGSTRALDDAERAASRPSIEIPPPPLPAAIVHAGILDPWAEGGAGPELENIPGFPAGDRSRPPDEEPEAGHGEPNDTLIPQGGSVPPSIGTGDFSQTPVPSGEPEAEAEPPQAGIPTPVPTGAADAAPRPTPAPASPAHASPVPASEPAEAALAFSLESVEVFADLPEDAQADLVKVARVEALAPDEEVAASGLTLVLEGTASVQPTIADVVAVRLQEGDVVYARGSLTDGGSLRVVAAATGAKVAVWTDAAIDAALATCPWVKDELRAAADKLHALAGASMGPLGERLDEPLRRIALGRAAVRVLAPGEAVASEGLPVAGMFVVGAGSIELETDGVASGKLEPGDFLFATEVLGGDAAPATARAGSHGAIVLFNERHLAHELLVSCPPLLEIFAGV